MFLLFSGLSLYGVLWFIITIIFDAIIVKSFLKEDSIKFSKIFSEISFVKIPTIIIAMFLWWIIGTILLWLVNIIIDSSAYQIYFSLLWFIIIYIYFYKDFLKSAISNLKASINNEKKNIYVIASLSLIITIFVNILIQVIVPILGL